jgi:hypothetical protein
VHAAWKERRQAGESAAAAAARQSLHGALAFAASGTPVAYEVK